MNHRGIIAIILASAIALILIMGVAGAIWNGHQISDSGRELLLVLGGAIVGALAGFMSTKAGNGH